MPSCAPNITIREREERELFTLWSRPQICSHPAAPPGQQLSRLTASFLSVKPSPICALRTVMILTHRWTSFSSTRTPQGKVFWDWKKAHLVYFVLSSSFFRPNWTGYQSHVQEEGSERQRELQEPQGVAKQREDGERTGRRRRSVLRTGLSQQTVPQQQRRVLWHRLQGELR